MARTPETAGAAPSADATKRKPQVRKQGPRTVYVLFNEGTDPALISQFQGALSKLTMNGRALLDALKGGKQVPFLNLTIEVEPKDGGGDSAE